ncbi:MAG: phosphate ABC transporter substrate-binding protein [Desulfuromonadales bacterium]|nr:phosphate ABC transporter substrate-binding protein [Desulfuromonadales bacterium]
MKKLVALMILLVFVIAAVPALAAEISYSGSSTIGTSVMKAGAVSAFEAKTGIKFTKVDEPGSGKGIKALLAGEVPLAGASRPLKPEEKKDKLIGTTIGYDAIAVFIHKDNPVKDLTKEQLKGIFTGQIKNWKEVGGKDAPITPNTEILTGKRATIEMFQELVLDGAAFGPGFKQIDLPRDQIIDLANTPNGICTVSLGLLAATSSDVQAKVKAVSLNGLAPDDKNIQSGAYLISRPLLLVTKGLPKDEVKEFVTFMLSSEGQAIVAKNFVPVRK